MKWILPVVLIAVAPASADFTINQPASGVVGKGTFDDGTSAGPTDSITSRIEGVAIDPVSGKLFIADVGNHRILRFAAAAAYQNGAAAEAVLGQADFVSGSANRGGGPEANTLSGPAALSIDGAGRLWVADRGNNRVLRFDNAASKNTGDPANGVLGQLNFTSNLSDLTQATMDGPGGVFADAGGRLWVGDTGNSRVMRFDNAGALSNGAVANGVLGQPGFVTDAVAVTANGFNAPWGITGDAAGRIWVVDANNRRVLRFDAAAAKSNGAAADAVLGQPDFETNSVPLPTSRSLNQPYYATLAPNGTLWVGDTNNRRLLGYRAAASKGNGAAADLVLGQPDFTQSLNSGATPRAVNYSSQIAFDRKGMLFVGDYNLRRVLRFAPAIELRAPNRLTTKNGRVKIRGTSAYADRVEFKAPKSGFRKASGPPTRWFINLRGIVKPTTKVQIRATASDSRQARRVVTVKLKK